MFTSSLSEVYFVIVIEAAYNKALRTGNRFVNSNSWKLGLRTIKTPVKPKAIADQRLIPINSFKKSLANIETKKGHEKNKALAVASYI